VLCNKCRYVKFVGLQVKLLLGFRSNLRRSAGEFFWKKIVSSKLLKFLAFRTELLLTSFPRISYAAWHAICTDKWLDLKRGTIRNEPRMLWLLGSSA
jgi:hypothetical protein